MSTDSYMGTETSVPLVPPDLLFERDLRTVLKIFQDRRLKEPSDPQFPDSVVSPELYFTSSK